MNRKEEGLDPQTRGDRFRGLSNSLRLLCPYGRYSRQCFSRVIARGQ